MKNLLRISVFATAALALSACALPHSQTASGAVRPTLAVAGAAPDALLYIDNVLMGPVAQYDGHANVLKIEEGMHRISIVRNGAVLHEEKIYAAGGENKVIDIGGAQ
ncbi:MAG TPA: hypothetical protein VGN04_17200 [Herbaspirillum sp.]